MLLRCSNTECESHEGTTPVFACRILYDADRDPIEEVKQIEAVYFECTHCGSSAEDETKIIN